MESELEVEVEVGTGRAREDPRGGSARMTDGKEGRGIDLGTKLAVCNCAWITRGAGPGSFGEALSQGRASSRARARAWRGEARPGQASGGEGTDGMQARAAGCTLQNGFPRVG